jgi:phosphoglycerate-specific signal transduction histidine kinase
MSKHYNKTLLELQHKMDLSRVGACSSCYAASFHETREWAKQAVAKHRAMSKDVRESLNYLIRQLDWYDKDVEESFTSMRKST